MAQTVKHLPTMRETGGQSLGWEDLLEKAMATHSSTLTWKIPWTEEPGRLPSMGSHRVGHDWSDLAVAVILIRRIPRWLNGQEFTCQAWDASLVFGSGWSPAEGNGNPLQYSYLENPTDRGAWQATVHGVTKESVMTWLLNNKNHNKSSLLLIAVYSQIMY